MAKLNNPKTPIYTKEGAKAKRINYELQLRRSVMACMLWEDSFYEDGMSVAKRIEDAIPNVRPHIVSQIAKDARSKMNLRHVPLLITRAMARIPSHKHLVAETLEYIIQRPDELTEFLAIYWKDGKQPLSAQVKKGLAKAFTKFDEFQLAKYNRNNEIKLKDVLFLCHSKPKTGVKGYDKQARRKGVWTPKDTGSVLYRKLVDNTLQTPDTWEVGLSSGEDKQQVWTRLLTQNKMGGLAILRNLRNFQRDGVNENLIVDSIVNMKTDRILPYRFIASARYAPQWESYLETPMLKCLEGRQKLRGHTVLLVDVSGSMGNKLSSKSEISRLDAACGLAILLREICERVDIITFSSQVVRVPARRGFALRDAIVTSQQHGCTYLGAAVNHVYSNKRTSVVNNRSPHAAYINRNTVGLDLNPDRLIVLTDEQSHDPVSDPKSKGYMINVSTEKHGVGYGAWFHVDGFSEAIIDYIIQYEDFEREIY
jgi:60 kDa SS-A/Ro ribonucleoprotein